MRQKDFSPRENQSKFQHYLKRFLVLDVFFVHMCTYILMQLVNLPLPYSSRVANCARLFSLYHIFLLIYM